MINANTRRIEFAGENDIEELARLYDETNDFLEAGVNYPGWRKGVYPTKADAVAAFAENSLIVLRVEEKIAGALVLNQLPEDAYAQASWGVAASPSEVFVIRTLAVHPSFTKQGVAKDLLCYCEAHARGQNAKAIRLDVAIQNAPAIALYESCGYRYIGTVDLGLPYEHLKWFRLYERAL